MLLIYWKGHISVKLDKDMEYILLVKMQDGWFTLEIFSNFPIMFRPLNLAIFSYGVTEDKWNNFYM